MAALKDAGSKTVRTLRWIDGIRGHLALIDQTRLPLECVEIECRDVETVWEAIRALRVRGAPAIGIATSNRMPSRVRRIGMPIPGVCNGFSHAVDPGRIVGERWRGQRFPALVHDPGECRGKPCPDDFRLAARVGARPVELFIPAQRQ